MKAEEKKYNETKMQVRKSSRKMRGFLIHLTVYGMVNAMLVLINITTNPGVLWFYWPLAGWGIGLVAHALNAFTFDSMFGPAWEEKKIKEIMEH